MQNKKLRCFVILKDQPSLAIFKILGYGYPIFNSLITLQHTQNCIPYNIQAPAAAPVLSQESGQGRAYAHGGRREGEEAVGRGDQG